jgi:hypothetical protein
LVPSAAADAYDFPCLLPAYRLESATFGTLAREKKRLTVREPLLLCPEQQRAWQVHLTSGQEDQLGQATGILQVRQNEAVTPHIHRSKSQRLADTGAGCPEHTQQQAIALGARGIDDGQDLVGRKTFRRLPLLGRCGSDRTSFRTRI